MDSLDSMILAEMEKDSRISLKKLAKKLNLKISSIYSRLLKLQNNGIINHYSIVVNTEEIGLKIHKFLSLTLEKNSDEGLNEIFLSGIANYLVNSFREIHFLCFGQEGDEEKIYIIASFQNEEGWAAFKKKLDGVPNTKRDQTVELKNIVYGNKLFSFKAIQPPAT